MYILFITLGMQPCCPFSRSYKCPLRNPSAHLAEIWPQVFLRNQGSSSFPANFALGPLSGFGGNVKHKKRTIQNLKSENECCSGLFAIECVWQTTTWQLDTVNGHWGHWLLKKRQVTLTWRSRSRRTSRSIMSQWVSNVLAPRWTCLNLEV